MHWPGGSVQPCLADEPCRRVHGLRDGTGDDSGAVEADEPAGVISVVAGFALMMALDVAL